jgi:hypothetical protein
MCKAHGGVLSIEGVTVGVVNDKLQLQNVETWYDPLSLFRQMGPVLPYKDDESATLNNLPANTDEKDYMDDAQSSSAAATQCPFMKGKL